MERKPFAASLVFGALSLAGILAMLSQSSTALGERDAIRGSSWDYRISLDPSPESTPDRVIEAGVHHQIRESAATEEDRDRSRPRPGVLRLR